MTQVQVGNGSFRDPSGRLVALDGRLYRLVYRSGEDEVRAWMALPAHQALRASGHVVGSRVLPSSEAHQLLQHPQLGPCRRDGVTSILEHPRIPFASFPYEWTPGMLAVAGRLTLELAEALLVEGWGLKDATPFNVLFQGPRPIFVDLLSFERRDPKDATWLPYAQFVRTFLLPLLAHRHFGLSMRQVFSVRREGLEPEEVFRLCSPLQKLQPVFLSLVTLPTWLGARRGDADPRLYRSQAAQSADKAQFILRCLFRQLRRSLEAVARARPRPSGWTEYMRDKRYPDEAFAVKETVVRRVLAEHRPQAVLDVGCNTGHFSAMAASSGARVVAIDADPAVVSATWRRADAGGQNILPLVVDLAQPSPALGWRNRECPAFLDRARQGFDLVLMLAVIHHLLVTQRVPLDDLLDLTAELTRDLAVMEFVAPQDAMFQRITRGREALFAGLSPAVFEAACRRRFEVRHVERLVGTHRWLYVLKRTPENDAPHR